jgi:hypothetical protein
LLCLFSLIANLLFAILCPRICFLPVTWTEWWFTLLRAQGYVEDSFTNFIKHSPSPVIPHKTHLIKMYNLYFKHPWLG